MIAMWDNTKKRAIVLGDTVRSPVELSDCLYHIEIIYLVGGLPIKEIREFIVGKNMLMTSSGLYHRNQLLIREFLRFNEL